MDPNLFLPAFAMLTLIIITGFLMGYARFRAVSSGATKDLALDVGQRNWPGWSAQASACFNNQFEMPILFFIAIIFAALTQTAAPFFIILAWAYVATRIAHATIYLTTNIILYRFIAFTVGFLIIVIMWALVAVKVLSASA